MRKLRAQDGGRGEGENEGGENGGGKGGGVKGGGVDEGDKVKPATWNVIFFVFLT